VKKILASLLAITMLLTTMSACVIPVSASVSSVATTEIFTEDFEGYKKGVNWISNVTDSFVASTNTDVTDGDWAIIASKQGATGAEVMPVDAGDQGLETDGVERGQVLKINGGNTGTTILSLQRMLTNETEMGTKNTNWANATSFGSVQTSYVSRTNLLKASAGKKLVYEVDFFTPSDFYTGEAHFMTGMSANNTVSQYSAGTGGIYTSLQANYQHYLTTMGNSSSSHYARSQFYTNNRGSWQKMKVVLDISEAASENHWHTSRTYYNDKLVTARYTTDPASTAYLTGSAAYTNENKTNGTTGDEVYDFGMLNSVPTSTTPYVQFGSSFHGWMFSAKNYKSYDGKAVYYIDNFKAYWVDALAMGTPVNTENYKTGTIDIPFNSVIDESVTKFNQTLVTKADSTSGYNTYVRNKDDDTTTKTIAEVADATKALITIVDANGNLVEGGVKSVALTNGGKTVSVTPDMEKLAGNTTYKIAIDPMFCDVYGQALTATTAATPVTNYVEFNTAASEFVAEVDKASISATAGSETAVATVTLSEAVESIAGAFTVRDAGGEAVEEGWSATLSDNGMEVTLDFADLAAGSYELTMETITAANGKELTNAEEIVISITLSAPVSKYTLFVEDFESGYTVDEDWLHAKAADGETLKYAVATTDALSGSDNYVFTVGDHTWDIQVDETNAGTFTTDDSIKVVNTEGLDLGGNFSGNALYVKAISNGNIKDVVELRRNFDKLNGISLTKQYLDEEETIANPYYGMKLVYELDYKTLASQKADAYRLIPSAVKTELNPVNTQSKYVPLCSAWGVLRMGSYRNATLSATNGSAHNWYGTTSNALKANKAGKITIVVDQASAVDTVKLYVNDVLITMPHNMALSDHPLYGTDVSEWSAINYQGKETSFGDVMYGLSFVGASKDSSLTDEFYIDNLKAYIVDSFDVVSVTGASNQFNIAEDEVVFTFTNPVLSLENAEASVAVKDASGNAVDGIDAVALSADKRTMTVTLKDLAGAAKYTVELLPTLRDENGIGITPQHEWYDYVTTLDNVSSVVDGVATYTVGDVTSTTQASCYILNKDADGMNTVVSIVTSKSASVSAVPTPASISGNTVSTTLTFANVANEDLPVWYVVAAYGEYNEMLNCSAASKTVATGASNDTVTVSFTVEDGTKVESVKVYIWDGISTMVPYQDVEEIK